MLSWLWSAMGLGTSVEIETGGAGAGGELQGPSRAHFSVAFTSQLEGSDDPQKVPFDRVLSRNPETSFDTEANQFTCTIPGSYFFTFTIHPQEGKAAAVLLMKNEDKQVLAYAHKSKRAPGTVSQSAILDLAEGDTVWLQLQSGDEYGIQSHPGTPLVTFNGVLVNAM